MIEECVNSLPVWFFQNLLNYGEIYHFVSTRIGGFSRPPYNFLNLGFHVGDDPEIVLKNREQLATALTIPLNNFTVANQVHGCNITIITEELRGSGAFHHNSAVTTTDAMVTNIPNICLMVLQADCVPLLFFDWRKKVIGVVHAGWRGTVQMITKKMVRVLQEEFSCSAHNILIGIGPSIGPCCYEIGPETAVNIKKTFCNEGISIDTVISDGTYYFDLWEANKIQLIEMGIPEKNIEIAKVCTYCNHTLLFSYRHQQKKETGRFGAGIMLI